MNKYFKKIITLLMLCALCISNILMSTITVHAYSEPVTNIIVEKKHIFREYPNMQKVIFTFSDTQIKSAIISYKFPNGGYTQFNLNKNADNQYEASIPLYIAEAGLWEASSITIDYLDGSYKLLMDYDIYNDGYGNIQLDDANFTTYDTDNQGPIFDGIELNKNSFEKGERIEVTVATRDLLSDIKKVEVIFFKPSGGQVLLRIDGWNSIGDNKYKGIIDGSLIDESGKYECILITMYDSKFNSTSVIDKDYSAGDIQKVDLSGVDFKVENGIDIPDINLKVAIYNILGKDFNENLTKKELQNIVSLDLSGLGITNLEGIQYCINLSELYLLDNNISDISTLGNLTNLRRLNLSNNKISDIGALASLSSLETLSLASNNVSDISALSNLKQLYWIFLSDNKISDINVFTNWDNSNLNWLMLNNNMINNITPISKLTNLQQLNISGNDITDISSLSNLINIWELDASNNNINDISVLSNLNNLTDIYLSRNDIEDISSLANLIISKLDLADNKIRDLKPLKGITYSAYSDTIRLDKNYIDLNDNEVNNILTSLQNKGYTLTYTMQFSKPIITATDVRIQLGCSFNYLEGVSASDKEDGDITYKVTVDGEVDINKIGEYLVTYKVVDSDGNEYKLVRKVIVTYAREDVNTDTVIDIYDLSMVASNYNKTSEDSEWNKNLDINNDEFVDLYDLVIISKNIE